MKKTLFAALLAVATLIGFTACKNSDSDKNVDRQCWAVTATTTMEGMSLPVTTYVWASTAEIAITVESTKAELAKEGVEATVSYAPANASDAASCTKQSNPADPSQSQCWAMTVNYGGIGITTYIWGPESAVQAAVTAAKKDPETAGATITYAPAQANDAASCSKLNNQY